MFDGDPAALPHICTPGTSKHRAARQLLKDRIVRLIDQRLASAKENGTDLSKDSDMLATMLTMDVRQCSFDSPR